MPMRKWGCPLFLLMLSALLLIILSGRQAEAAAAPVPAPIQIKVLVDGIKINFNEPPAVVRGTTYVRESELFGALYPDKPGKESDLLVPLRTTSESEGALVAWDAMNAEINIFTKEMLAALGVTKEKASKIVYEYLEESRNQLQSLQGMYYRMRIDSSGQKCGGTCWDFYTFLPDRKLVIGEPAGGGMETIDCASETCHSYTIKDGVLKVSNGAQYRISMSRQGNLILDREPMAKVKPVDGSLKLEGKYVNRGYSKLDSEGKAADAWEEWLTFERGGKFQSERLKLQGSKGETRASSGTYRISGNTILLRYQNGATERQLFFVHDGADGKSDPADIQIGRRNYYMEADE